MSKLNYAELKKPEHHLDIARWDQTFVFDIETMGEPAKVREFGKDYPPFVEPKYGNIKDPIKKQAFYDEKYKQWEEGESDWWSKQFERAALSAVTGRIVAIGYLFPYAHKQVDDDTLWDKIVIDGLTPMGNRDMEESQMLTTFWRRFSDAAVSYGHIIGHNCEAFDLVFLMQRSWQLGVAVSPMVMRGRYFHQNVVDTMKVWCGYAFKETISLDNLSKLLGVGKKMQSYHATQFAEDWLNGDKETAEFYLKNDLNLTLGCYEKLYKT